MINYKILFWGAKSKSSILMNMIKNNELFYGNKKIRNKKICLLVDPFLKKPDFETNIPFVFKKNDFEKNLNKVNSFIVGIGGSYGKARYLISNKLIKKKLKPLSLIHKTTFIDKTSFLGTGNQIMPNVVIHCYSKIVFAEPRSSAKGINLIKKYRLSSGLRLPSLKNFFSYSKDADKQSVSYW